MNAPGWLLAAGLVLAPLAALLVRRHRAPGRHRLAPLPVEPPTARPPRRVSWSGDLADALADEPTRVLPRLAPRPPTSYARDPETLRRLLDGLRAL
ncbi:hypothetical protein [Saccharopolyspora sp. CA-218241]|uniref:hypothetical protein n=1 Tax=Saccharopolyspora sp. CA-218241 TaxID=3240027 RepID=UPI003D953EFB